jgi:hypothetical protein
MGHVQICRRSRPDLPVEYPQKTGVLPGTFILDQALVI